MDGQRQGVCGRGWVFHSMAVTYRVKRHLEIQSRAACGRLRYKVRPPVRL